MKKLFILLLISLSVSTVYGQEKKKVAIFESIGNAVDEDVKGAILDALGEGIYNSDKYILLERANYAQLLKEYDFQQSGAVDDNQLLEIGKAAGADYACYASIRKIGINYRIAYRLVEVSTAAIEFSGSKSTQKGINDLLNVINAIAEEMFTEKNSGDVKPTTPTPTPTQKQPPPTNVAQTIPTVNPTVSPLTRSVMELVKQKLGRKINAYNTDEDKFDRVKSDSEIRKLIKFGAKNVSATPPQPDNIVFFCQGVARRGDSPLFIFLDGRMIGVGTVDKGILAIIPNDNLPHTLTVWTSSAKIYSTTVNFAQKNEYIFTWDGKTIRL